VTDEITTAIELLKAQGYSVTKAKRSKKSQRGPTVVALFADGEQARMTVHSPVDKLDWQRGERMAVYAWQSRKRLPLARRLVEVRDQLWSAEIEQMRGCGLMFSFGNQPPPYAAETPTMEERARRRKLEREYLKLLAEWNRFDPVKPPRIVALHFERDGVVLAKRSA